MKSLIDNNHLSQDLIIRMLDDELPVATRMECETHLAACEVCRGQLSSAHDFSILIESAVQSTVIPDMDSVRRELENRIQSRNQHSRLASHSGHQSPGNVMRRFGWGMGIAATLAFAILMAPRHDLSPLPETANDAQVSAAQQTAVIEVDGEAFLPVPYSNADLSTAAPHIVQMQVPVSSLADIGIVFEPVTNRAGAADGSGAEGGERSVLADVLVGADGQPRGVHILGFE